jgi:ankyrin repeat protein
MLLQAGAVKDWVLNAALVSAIRKRHPGVVKFLILAGANVTYASFYAAAESFPERSEEYSGIGKDRHNTDAVVQLFLHPRLRVADDHDLLIAAMAKGHGTTVELLLHAGAKIHGYTTP